MGKTETRWDRAAKLAEEATQKALSALPGVFAQLIGEDEDARVIRFEVGGEMFASTVSRIAPARPTSV